MTLRSIGLVARPVPVSRLGAILVAVLAISLGVAACGPARPELSDPIEILRAGAASLEDIESFHVRGAIEGEIALDIGGIGGGAPLGLGGTTLDGDVDVTAGELAAELLAPSLFNARVSIVVADGSSYLKAPIITGGGWIRQPGAEGIGGDVGAAVEGLRDFLARPGLAPEKLSDTRCAGTDCYSVRFVVPGEQVRDALGSLGSAVPGLSGDSVGDVTVTAGIRKDDLRLTTLGVEIPTGGTKPLSIDLELSKVNEPVTISPPPADEVNDPPAG
jgi:hypothetical protein